MFAIDSTPGFDDGARQLRRLAARHAVSAVGRAARSIVGCVLGGVTCSRLC
jgi:hypothetical protein